MPRLIQMIALAITAALLPAVAAPAQATERRVLANPNVLLIYVDDMALSDLAYMDYTRTLFEQSGTTFTHAINPHPLCCPARAELMTGQYAHNNGVFHNDGPYGGYGAFAAAGMQRLITQWFHDDGYQTAYVGKYLNGYNGGDIVGTDVTEALSKNVYAPYGFSSWDNGAETVRDKHTTDWTADRTANLITGKFANTPGPFMSVAAFLAPHSMMKNGEWVPPYARIGPGATEPMPIPPRRYTTLEPGDDVLPSLSKPSFNEEDMSDKPTEVQGAKVDPEKMKAQHKARVLSLYAVDDGVQRIVTALKNAGVYSNTVLAFTSDNGYLLGEHRRDGKDQPYQESVRVPLMIRGPGVAVGQNPNVVTTVDIPRTLAALAGVSPNRVQDGINAFNSTADRKVLIQSGAATQKFDWRGVYTARYTYVERGSEVEFYDRQSDPYELRSDPAAGKASGLGAVLDALRGCAGSGCVR